MIKSLRQTIAIWANTKKVRGSPLVKNLKTSFTQYILPEPEAVDINQLSPEKSLDSCYEINILDFKESEAIKAFDKAFKARVEKGEVALRTKGNYRLALKKFFHWLSTQAWYKEHLSLPKPSSCPKRVYAQRLPPRIYEGARFYGLTELELPEKIKHDLDRYVFFWSNGSQIADLEHLESFKQAAQPSDLRSLRLRQSKEQIQLGCIVVRPTVAKISKSTLKDRRTLIRSFFGWCVNIEGYSIDQLSLDWITRKVFYLDYINWLIEKRGCGYSVGGKVLLVSLSVAKYQTFHLSSKSNWSDIRLIKFIQQKLREFKELDDQEQFSKQEEKWKHKKISHLKAREVVDYLYQFCAPRSPLHFSKGRQYTRKRTISTLVACWQDYLIIKFLVYVPVRQQELTKLKIGTTLRIVQDSQGICRYAVRIADHKRSAQTGKPRYYPLPKILTRDITTWIEEIRPLAISAPSTLENWLSFWGHSLNKLARSKQRLELAQSTEGMTERYSRSLKNTIKGIQGKIDAWDTVQKNAQSCDHLFFTLGSTYPLAFCQDWHASSLSSSVNRTVSGATKALYGEAKHLSPHKFRNTGAKHLRAIGREADKEAFSALLGHTVEIDDDYANVITDDFELLEDYVDDWWL